MVFQLPRRIAWFVIKASVIFPLLIGAVFFSVVLADYKSDTTHITTTAFGIVAVLSSLSFSCARALNADDKDRDRFTYAGERFMHASMMLMAASVIKYAAVVIWRTSFGLAHTILMPILTFPLGITVAVLFMQTLFSAHTGLRVCSDLLWPRLNRYGDHDKIA